MKKKTSIFVVMVLTLALLLTGCIQLNVELTVKEDMSGEVTVKAGVLNSVASMVGDTKDLFSDLYEAADDDKNLTASSYKNKDYQGVQVTGKIADVSEGNDDLLGKGFVVTKTQVEGKDAFKLNIPANSVTGSITESAGQSLSSLEEYGKMDLKVIVTFPYPVAETNGTLSNGNKTVTWDLLTFTEKNMTAVAVKGAKGGGGSGFLVVLIVIIVLVVAALVVFALMKSKGGSKKASTTSTGFVPYTPPTITPEDDKKE